MKLEDLIKAETNVSLNVTYDDLKRLLDQAIQKSKTELEQTIIEGKSESYLSREKVAEMLDVDPSTLFRWKNKGYLVPIEVGGKRRYKMSDVKKILNGEKGRK